MAPKRKQLVAAPGGEASREKPSSDSRFPSEYHQHTFRTHTFQLLPSRSLDRDFFALHAPLVLEVIEFYRISKLVYCMHDINIDLVTEFYNNLQPTGDRLLCKSRVAKRDITFTPRSLQVFLECRESSSHLEVYPTIPEPLEGFSIESIHQIFFNKPRQPGLNLFPAMSLSAPDNVLYKVIVGCLLPIVTRGQAKVRTHHLLALHILKNKIDFNIALNVYLCILHFSSPVQKKIYMPFGHILTQWLESLGINTTRGQVKKVSEKYDVIKWRNFSLAGMTKIFRSVEWADGRQAGEWDSEDEEEEEPIPLADEPYSTVSDQMGQLSTKVEELTETMDTRFEELHLEIDLISTRQNQILIQQAEILKLLQSTSTDASVPSSPNI